MPKTLNTDCPKICVGMPVVLTDGRSVYGHVIAKWFTRFSYPWCSAARARAPLRIFNHFYLKRMGKEKINISTYWNSMGKSKGREGYPS